MHQIVVPLKYFHHLRKHFIRYYFRVGFTLKLAVFIFTPRFTVLLEHVLESFSTLIRKHLPSCVYILWNWTFRPLSCSLVIAIRHIIWKVNDVVIKRQMSCMHTIPEISCFAASLSMIFQFFSFSFPTLHRASILVPDIIVAKFLYFYDTEFCTLHIEKTFRPK